uniref:Alpha-2-macroglobulin domain-containing protein n=1 Tax=Oryzias sinensis TaxID=183150 RepID=A0A8C8DN87_9TELE
MTNENGTFAHMSGASEVTVKHNLGALKHKTAFLSTCTSEEDRRQEASTLPRRNNDGHSKISPNNSYSFFQPFFYYIFIYLFLSLKQDPLGNKIGQWQNKTSNSKILQLSYPLSPEARVGRYNIIIKIGEEEVDLDFRVEKHGMYTYGQPVPGYFFVRLCRPIHRDLISGLCNIQKKRVCNICLVASMTLMYLHSQPAHFFMLMRDISTIVQFLMNVGKITLKLRITPDLAPEFQLVVYAVLPSKDVIASSGGFSTEKCFSNKVSLTFSPSSAVPGEQIKLRLTAQPNSLCGLSAVDQSVLINDPGKTLSADKVQMIVKPDTMEFCFMCLFVCFLITDYRSRYTHNSVFESYPSSRSSFPPPPTVRSFFPETWIWDLVEVGESGTKDVFLTAPDTITTWETETFCLSSQGFGLAPRKKLTVFQPFFLELTLPYSIIRGESFELKATVFNYLNSCIMVRVTPGVSSSYVITPVSTEEYTSCLCDSERKSFHWNMNPTALGVVNITVTAEAIPSHTRCDNEIVSVPERGRIDIVTKSLIVKVTEETVIEKTDLELPDNVIDGSARASVSVSGDVIGRALRNIEGLLKMPYGCGEQNMALLAPNIYILHYLQNTHQLTPAIKEKALNFLTSGYQRQLNYKDNQGAYSTFGTGLGNTWLTAFVVKSFFKAKSFIYIDPSVVQRSTSWLKSKQKENGCFEKSGKLFSNRMKGGVSDEVTLSAYITAAFLEMNTSTNNPVVTRSLSCLKGSINDLSNTYTTALLAYVFTLAGDMETRAHLLQHLDRVAVKKGNVIYWTQTADETSDSLSVEISSYVLMSLLSTSHTAEDLGYASSIVRWMTGQQNYYGGFSSTQDTVAALQALALYATVVFSPEGSSTVTVQSSSVQLEFDVKPDNKLLYQEKVMNNATGKYTLQVKGTACSSIQVNKCKCSYLTDVCFHFLHNSFSKFLLLLSEGRRKI